MNPSIGIIELAQLIADTLNIPKNELVDLIRKKLTQEEIDKSSENHKDKINEIRNLLQSDVDINNFGDSLKNLAVKNNFDKLKNNLGKLQVLVLLKKIGKSKDCDDILNTFIGIINNKVSIVNDILEKKMDGGQIGGGCKDTKYIGKYIKYKLKYLLLKQ
jgi:hypothetical protein